jgi:hypothetical protein
MTVINNADAVYLGGTAVDRVYLGSERVWPAFSPVELFANSEQGAWYNPGDLSSLFQDSAGTVPVTADGDPVGKMLDLSGNGNHATQSVSGSRPVYRTDGALHCLEGDGVDDFLRNTTVNFTATSLSLLVAGNHGIDGGSGLQGIFKAGNSDIGSSDDFILLRPTTSSGVSDGSDFKHYSFGVTNNANFITEIYYRSSGISFLLDGATVNEINTSLGAIAVTNDIIILSSLQTEQYWDGRFYGSIFRDGEFAAPEKSQARTYLAGLAGVTL